MRLPNVDIATIDEDKVVNYLLNENHPDGASKARFFKALGFDPGDWQQLAIVLIDVARDSEVTKFVESVHGRKYIIEGVIKSSIGRIAFIRTVWITDKDGDAPRLVTAYPCE